MPKEFEKLLEIANNGTPEEQDALLDALYQEKIKRKDAIINALCDSASKCPKCYRWLVGSECSGCQSYYCECDCEPLKPEQIVSGESDE